ncbi:MAG TPA: GNAT family N-acetyltransferase [Planococcus sp. (in: firmicutes)]|nr:GNAT family N-acetyltransferase [Planococcus sp. (in: firmicutes)]
METTERIFIRVFKDSDFPAIQRLNESEGWTNLASKPDIVKAAWQHSNVAFVAERQGEVVGCMRGLTDQFITLYICELLIDGNCRGEGIGKALLDHVHALYRGTRMEMLASSTSQSYYEAHGYRPFYGFRKTFNE